MSISGLMYCAPTILVALTLDLSRQNYYVATKRIN